MEGAKITVNGDTLTAKLELHHNDRVVFSSGHVYVLHHPHQFRKAEKEGKKFDPVTWSTVQTEIAEKSGYDVDSKGKSQDELLLQEDLISLMPMVNGVNAISEELDKKKHFELALVSPQARGLTSGRTIVMVKMVDLVQGNYWLWDRNKFINRKYKMEEMYQSFEEGDEDWDVPSEIDPFYEDINSHVLIGQSQVHLKCLTYLIGFQESIIITDYEARERGFLQIQIEPLKPDGTPIGDEDEEYFIEEPSELVGTSLSYDFRIIGAKGLPSMMSEDVYCEFKLYLDDTTNKTQELSSKNPDWDWRRTFSHEPVTEQLIEYLTEEPLIVEVWGRQKQEGSKRSTENLTTKQLKSHNEKEKIAAAMKKVTGNAGNIDVRSVLSKVELLMSTIEEIREVVRGAKERQQTTLDVSVIEEILARSDSTRFEEVSRIIELEKTAESKVCSVQ